VGVELITGTITMNTIELSKEQRILRLMRKTLGNVVKDVTPGPGRENPLSENTILDIRDCFALISEREKELAEALEFDPAKPYYADDKQERPNVIEFTKPKKE
jgi:hypothetical protein